MFAGGGRALRSVSFFRGVHALRLKATLEFWSEMRHQVPARSGQPVLLFRFGGSSNRRGAVTHSFVFLKKPILFNFQKISELLALFLGGLTVAVDDLAEDTFVHPQRASDMVLMNPQPENLQL